MTLTPSTLPSRPRIIAVTNQKGGVGKTTTAVNLAAGLAESGLRCLLVDLDPQGNASTGLGSLASMRGLTAYDCLSQGEPLANAIAATDLPGLDLVPGSVDLSGLDAELADQQDRAFRLKRLIENQLQIVSNARYNYILIDCPPSLNLLTVNAMVAADAVIVPLQCEFFALEGLTQLLSTVRQIQGGLNPSLTIHGIVLTMYDQRNRLSGQVAQDVRDNLGEIVFSTMIPRNVRLSEAPSHAMPALVYDPGCAGSIAYRQLTAEFLARDGVEIAA